MATASRQKSDSWLRHAEALQNVDPEYAHLLRSRAQLAESQSAKYINRQHRLNNNLRTHHDLPVIDAEQTGLNRSLERIQALGRGPATRVDAARVRSLNRLALQQSSDNLVDTFAQVARLSPGQSGAASRAIANELINMPAANAGEAISRLERSAGSRFARDVAENARQLRAARSTPSARLTPEPPAGIGVVKILTTSIGAYFMGREGVYHALSQTEGDDTAFDFVVRVYTNAAWYGSGIGYAYEEAEQAEIERFTRRLERGEDPSLLHAVNVILLKIPYLMARDSAFGLLYLPDSIYEAITGEQEAKAREQASIDFLAEVQRLVQHRESIDEALLYAEDMGIYPEDRQRFLNCLCTRCGGALGGMFCSEPCPRNFPGRRGPCLCRGTLNTWNTPIPGGTQDSLDCFNAITRKNHAEALAIFNSWRDQMIAENFQSAEHDLKLINESIEAGELDTALSTFRMIQPLINDYVVPVDTGLAIVQSLPGRELGNRIGQALVDEALTIISDPDHANPMATALDRVARAQQISPLVWQQTRNRFENWDENWREVLQTTLPAVIADAEAGSLVSARASLDEVLDRLGSDLPPRRDDPRILAALEKLSDQELMLATAEKYWENARQYQAAADFEQAIAAYRQGLAIWKNPQILDRLERLESFVATGQHDHEPTDSPFGGQVALQTALEPQDLLTPPDRIDLTATVGKLDSEVNEQRHSIDVSRHGSLKVAIEANDALWLWMRLKDAEGNHLRTSNSGSNPKVTSPDLAPGTYFVRVVRVRGQGGYSLQSVFSPQFQAAGN